MRITFLGTGDAFGSGGRFNTCFHVAALEGDFLIDCGLSSMIALNRSAVDRNAVGTIFLSHLHGDHFGALPVFMLDAQFVSRRDDPLTVVGPPTTQERLRQAMEVTFAGMSEIDWRFDYRVIEIAPEVPETVNGVAVTGYEVDHPSGAPSLALRFSLEDKILVYSGDSQWTDALIAASDNADLFICECFGFEQQVPYHLDYATLREQRPRLSAKRIVLTHMGDEMLARLDDVEMETAHDGLEIDL